MVSCIFALCIIDGIRYDCGGDETVFFSYFLFLIFILFEKPKKTLWMVHYSNLIAAIKLETN